MKKNEIYHYYVEGEDEKSLINVLKRDMGCIVSGKVDKFNVIQNKFTVARIRPLRQGTIVVLVFDTDIETNIDILQYNVDFFKRQKGIKDVLCIPQVSNLEDELKRACRINNILQLTKSETIKDYKSDLVNCTNLGARLEKCQFDISKFWNQVPQNRYKKFGNDAGKIKICKKN